MTRTAFFVAPMNSTQAFARIVGALEAHDLSFSPLFSDMIATSRPERHAEWTLDSEVANLESLRQRNGGHTDLDLIGYSGGGAACLAYAAAHPEMIRSLTLIEHPWIGNDVWSDEEARWRAQYEAIAHVSDDDVWDAVCALFNTSDARPTKPLMPGPALREAFMLVWRGYSAAPLDRTRLERIDAPVYMPVGGASVPRMLAQATLLARHFPRAHTEVIEGVGHFDILIAGADRIARRIARSWEAVDGQA